MIRICLVDDQTLVRQGIRSLLALAEGIEVVAEAGDGKQALDVIPQIRPDVVLMDMAFGVVAQPGEGRRAFEGLLGRRLVGRTDVQGKAGMVLGITGCGVDREDLVDRQPARLLPFEDAQLVIVAAITGDGLEHDAIRSRGDAHRQPGARSAGTQP